MKEIQIYEDYDGYPGDTSHKVHYIDLGQNLTCKSHVICYTDLAFICHIHKKRHMCAWDYKTMPIRDVIVLVKKAYKGLPKNYGTSKGPLQDLKDKIEYLQANKIELDKPHSGRNFSCTADLLDFESIRCDIGESYTDKYIELLNKRIAMVEVVNTYLESICDEYSQGLMRHKMATKIQTMFRSVISNPNHLFCQNRLKREFDEFDTFNLNQFS